MAPPRAPEAGGGRGPSSVRGRRRLDELDEDATSVLGVHEVDPAVRRPAPGGVVEQPQAALAQRRADRLDVGHPEGQLLQARAGAADELGDRRLGGQRREQLDAGLAVADGEHRLADALLLVHLLVHRVDAEGLGVEGQGLVEIRDGDAHVVDRGEQLGRQAGARVGGHGGILPDQTSETTGGGATQPRGSVAHPGEGGHPGAATGTETLVTLVSGGEPASYPRLDMDVASPSWYGGTDPAVASVGDPPLEADMSRSVIVSGARTPMGRLLGSLKDFSAADLGGVAIKAALERAGISGDQVDYVIMGQVLQAGARQSPAPPAAVAGGIPMTVPSFTLNKVCLSGIGAIALADQLIRAGEFEVVVAGGMESMTQAPHLLMGQRQGQRYGDILVRDHMAYDGLVDPWDGLSMGEATDRSGERLGISRA